MTIYLPALLFWTLGPLVILCVAMQLCQLFLLLAQRFLK
jgi:hypothetical protein